MNTYVPIEQIKGAPDVIDELHRYMIFDAEPFVKRVVFLATPHRGSELSRRVVGRLSSNLINEPDHISDLLVKLVRDNPDAFPRRFRRLPTSIDTLDTDSPYLKALLTMKPNPDVAFHSIIGSLRPEGRKTRPTAWCRTAAPTSTASSRRSSSSPTTRYKTTLRDHGSPPDLAQACGARRDPGGERDERSRRAMIFAQFCAFRNQEFRVSGWLRVNLFTPECVPPASGV